MPLSLGRGFWAALPASGTTFVAWRGNQTAFAFLISKKFGATCFWSGQVARLVHEPSQFRGTYSAVTFSR